MLPALALGAEPANSRTMSGPRRTTEVVDGPLMRRALLLLGPTEALLSMGAFLTILTMGGWTYGDEASAGLLSVASGSAFAVIAVAQIANAFACRSAQVAVVELPALQTAFGTAHLDLNQWLVCAAMASSVLVFDEVRKLISRTRARH